MHRDIKLSNILRTKDDKIVLADLGCSVKAKKANSRTGSVGYFAPEILQGTYTHKVDIFSCGIVLIIMLTLKNPFASWAGESFDKIRQRNLIGKIHYEASEW